MAVAITIYQLKRKLFKGLKNEGIKTNYYYVEANFREAVWKRLYSLDSQGNAENCFNTKKGYINSSSKT
jgi:hypothetical protein